MDLNRAHRLALDALDQHGLTERGWSVVWDNAKRRAGVCKYGPKVIGLSRPIAALWEEADVLDTILHEVAHALTPGAGHGPEWRAACLRIGAKPDRCYSGDAPRPEAPWTTICPRGHEGGRHRRPTRVEGCGKCSRRFSSRYLLAYWHDGQRMTPEQIGGKYAAEWRTMRDHPLHGPNLAGLSWPIPERFAAPAAPAPAPAAAEPAPERLAASTPASSDTRLAWDRSDVGLF